jgi:hypothetical protein
VLVFAAASRISVHQACEQLERVPRPASLHLDRLLMWLIIEVAKHYRLLRNMPVYRDLRERAQAFIICHY